MANIIQSLKRYCGGSTVLASLILVNTAVFLAVWIVILIGRKFGLQGNFTISWLCVPSSPAAALTHPWTLLTYMVTQYDFNHLFFNILWLFWFGIFIPFFLSERRRLLLYAGAGLAGAAFYIAANLLFPQTNVAGGYLCGASASVLGTMTAVAVWQPKREIRLWIVGSVQMRWIAIFCITITFIGMNGGSWAAQSAHIGGVLFGLFFALATKSQVSSYDYYRNGAYETNRTDDTYSSPYTGTSSQNKTRPRRSVRFNVRRDGKAVADAAEHLSDTGRLDLLLDKIRISGYGSLSAGERNELMLLSQRLKKNESE